MSEPARARRGDPARRTKLVWIETPANPTWAITDIAAAAEIAHQAGARLAVDGTAATPVLSRPLALGADLVMHSATKYLNGHSDVVAGALVTARADELWQRLTALRHDAGAILGPFEAWLLLRGMRTLYLRSSAPRPARSSWPSACGRTRNVAAVLYPGLPEHPGHAVAAPPDAGRLRRHAVDPGRGRRGGRDRDRGTGRLWQRATSLGGVESLIEHRASIEGPGTPVPPDLLRLSVGIEHPDDLLADLEQALDRIA